MEKYLYLTKQEYAVLLHLTGKKPVTGFSIDFFEDTLKKRQLLFDLYRRGIIISTGDRFEVSEEWKAVFESVHTAEYVMWLSFEDKEKQDMLFYLCGRQAVCMENLSGPQDGRTGGRYRITMQDTSALRAGLTEGGFFPHIRVNREDGELLDRMLGAEDDQDSERICSVCFYRNGEPRWTERVTVEKDRFLYFVRTESALGTERRRAGRDEFERILERYFELRGVL